MKSLMKPFVIKGTTLGMDKNLVLLTMSDLMSSRPLIRGVIFPKPLIL